MSDRLLLVDDEPEILSALRRELAQDALEIIACSHPQEALTAIDSQEFAVIISDNIMPGASGLDLLAATRDRWPLTRRLLLTGATGMEEAVMAFNDGAIHRFIQKPWRREDLRQLLQKELDTYRQDRGAREHKATLEKTAKVRTAKLIETMDELKQSRTQVALFEDRMNLDKIVIPARVAALTTWVVDENEPVRSLLVSTLKQAGVKNCVGVDSAVEALWRIQNGQEVQVILSEWKMSTMDGLAFYRRLRDQGGPSTNAMFILVTGREQRPLVEFALKSGVDGYVIKPFQLQALLDQIDQLLRNTASRQGRLLDRFSEMACVVVNQHGASCDQIRHLLTAAGMGNVQTMQSGITALRVVSDRRVDLLLYDLNVKQPAWREIPSELARMPRRPALLLTSVLPTQQELAEVRAAGITDILPGPFRQTELLDAVARVTKI